MKNLSLCIDELIKTHDNMKDFLVDTISAQAYAIMMRSEIEKLKKAMKNVNGKTLTIQEGTKVRITYRPTVLDKDGKQMEFWGYVEEIFEDEGYILAVPFQEIDSVRYIYSPDNMSLISVAIDKVIPY